MSANYYDKQGNPLTDHEYFELLKREVREYKRVAVTEVGDVRISTVWLGLDHGWGDGPPIIFETMAFGGDADGDCDRYSTLEDAQEGHEAWVKAEEARA